MNNQLLCNRLLIIFSLLAQGIRKLTDFIQKMALIMAKPCTARRGTRIDGYVGPHGLDVGFVIKMEALHISLLMRMKMV